MNNEIQQKPKIGPAVSGYGSAHGHILYDAAGNIVSVSVNLTEEQFRVKAQEMAKIVRGGVGVAAQ